MTKEKIIELIEQKFGEELHWEEAVANELLALIEKEKKEVAREIIKRFGVETEKAWGLNYLAERIAKEYEVEL